MANESRRALCLTLRIRGLVYGGLRIIVALLLLVASALKAIDLTQRPVESTLSLTSHPITAVAVEVEIAVALLLLLGLWKPLVARLTAGLFGAFACVALSRVLMGQRSCGCFGAISVAPEYALAVDLVILVLCVAFRPAWQTSRVEASGTLVRRAVFASGILGATALLLWSFSYWRPARRFDDALRAGAFPYAMRDFVIVRPEDWIGRRCAIQDHIDIGDQFRHGRWAVGFYRSTCDHCSRLIREYFAKGSAALGVGEGYRVAMVRVDFPDRPRDAPSVEGPNREVVFGTLDGFRRWLLPTPVVVSFNEGRVTDVVGDPSPS
jgi:hypothetical protein